MSRTLTLHKPKPRYDPPPPADRTVYETLYSQAPGHPRFGHFPADDLMVGVEFEVGGAYEDWGWAVYQKVYEGKTRTFKCVASGRTLAAAMEAAEAYLQKRHAELLEKLPPPLYEGPGDE